MNRIRRLYGIPKNATYQEHRAHVKIKAMKIRLAWMKNQTRRPR